MVERRWSIAVLLALMIVAAACSPGDEADDCVRMTDPDHSVARVWNEATLDAIRRDFPAPTVHSRNLFHASAAMWDAWAAYDETAAGYFVDEYHRSRHVPEDREEAMSYAAYRLLRHRYRDATGGDESLAQFDATMAALCYPTDVTDADDDDPSQVGIRIADRVIAVTRGDGSLEGVAYEDETYEPANDPMILAESGTEMDDPNRWQPLAFEYAESQTGQPLPTNVQTFVGPHWGSVAAFALPTTSDGLPLDPGDPPYLGDAATDAEFKAAVLEVISYSSLLDPTDTEMIDIGPATRGNTPLGTYDSAGHSVNPVTGEPYAPNLVKQADFGRAVAEFWADGPESETPPGHWNTLANTVSDHPDMEYRIAGSGPEVDRLEWDVKLYLALNGATHDSAVAAWGAKSHYDYVRPISMIRWMGGLGQSSDPDGPAYHPEGLPLQPGLVEVVTAESGAPGGHHEHLADHVGEVAVLAWAGNPDDPETGLGLVDWIRAKDWVPYQKSTFVTPAFAAYVSGHSTFSRAAAEVLTEFTSSAYFPGGMGTWTIPADSLEFEAGPETPIDLQWATYADAADEAGISRLYGGIHVRADDLAGRIMGFDCGTAAWELAQKYYDGTIRG